MKNFDPTSYLRERAKTDPRAATALAQLNATRKKNTLERIASSVPQDAQKTAWSMIQVILPIPPSVNTMYVPTARGGRRLTDTAKNWKREATQIVSRAHSFKKSYAGQVSVDIAIYPADRRQFDIDNKLKCLLDALEDGGLILDDNQVVSIKIVKKSPYPRYPRVVLFVLPVEELKDSVL